MRLVPPLTDSRRGKGSTYSGQREKREKEREREREERERERRERKRLALLGWLGGPR